MARIDSGGGGGFAVDTDAVRTAAEQLARCARSVGTGRQCAQVDGLGEAQDVVRAVHDFSTAWNAALAGWQSSLSAYSQVVARAGAAMAEDDVHRAGPWAALGGEVP